MKNRIFRCLQGKNQRLFLLALPLFLTACASSPLSGAIHPPSGNTAEQTKADTLDCTNKSKVAADAAGHDAVGSLFAMTMLGQFVEHEIGMPKQRAVFATCMSGRGYQVSPFEDNDASPPDTKKSSASKKG